jgi:hypothetical protein
MLPRASTAYALHNPECGVRRGGHVMKGHACASLSHATRGVLRSAETA